MFDRDLNHSIFGASIRKYANRSTDRDPYLIFEYGFDEDELRQAIRKGKTVIVEFSENALACYKPYTCTTTMYGIGVWLNFGIKKSYTRYIMPRDMDKALKELAIYGGVRADKIWQFCAAVYENY